MVLCGGPIVRITHLARVSTVCPSVMYGLLGSKQKSENWCKHSQGENYQMC